MLAAWIAAWLGGADPVAAARAGHRAAAATVESPQTVRADLAACLDIDPTNETGQGDPR
jgi:pseudouridine kinase